MTKARVVVFIADDCQGGDFTIKKESLSIEGYLLNPIVLLDYNWTSYPLGKVNKLEWEGNKLLAELETNSETYEISKLYPAIGYMAKGDKAELMSISLCTKRNTDLRILTVEQQVLST